MNPLSHWTNASQSSTVPSEKNKTTATATSSSSLSIAEMVAQAAAEVVEAQRTELFSSYNYVAEYSMYWSEVERLYYDPTRQLFSSPDTGKHFYHDGTQYQSYEPVKAEEKKPQWSSAKFKRRAKKLFGDEAISKMEEGGEGGEEGQTQIDAMETVLDLVERCLFLAGDSKGIKRPGKGTNRGQSKRNVESQGRRMGGYIDLDMPLGEDDYQYTFTCGDGSQELAVSSESEETDDEDYYAAMEVERRRMEEEASRHAPCIRFIEVSNGNLLHIVTITGARVGYGLEMDVQLKRPAQEIDSADTREPLLTIAFQQCVEEEGSIGHYVVESAPCGVELRLNGEMIDGKQQIQHGDRLSVDGRHEFAMHIHTGLNTCTGCEQGLLTLPTEQDPSSLSKRPRLSRNTERRRNNRLMKMEYGLLEKEEPLSTKPNYKDRAKQRRRKVGSEPNSSTINAIGGIYSKCKATPKPGCSAETVELKLSVGATKKTSEEGPIESANKGFQLLKGMGWKEGEGLGREKQGIQKPIASTLKTDRTGLGSSSAAAGNGPIKIRLLSSSKLIQKSDVEKQTMWEKTRRRYEEIAKMDGSAGK